MKDLSKDEVQEKFERLKFTRKKYMTEISDKKLELYETPDFFKGTGIPHPGMYGIDISKIEIAIAQYINKDIQKKINTKSA